MPGEITESWKEKVFEVKYTEDWFEAGKILAEAQETPTIENIRRAFAHVKRSANALIENSNYADEFTNMIKPELRKMDLILYGNKMNPEVMIAMMEYGIIAVSDPRRKTETLINVQNILNQLWDIYRLTKQWAYKMGFFVRKPYDKKFGMSGIHEIFQQ